MDNRILCVSDNKEKQHTYRMQMIRYKKAISTGFYLEAIMIDYAMLEDRLLAFLHHAGIVTRNANKPKISKKSGKELRRLLNCTHIKISNITTKLAIIEILVQLHENQPDKYWVSVQKQIATTLESEDVLQICQAIRKWCDVRNQYVHGLLNKNYYAVQESWREFAVRGHDLCRDVDRLVDAFKKGNCIRKINNIQ